MKARCNGHMRQRFRIITTPPTSLAPDPPQARWLQIVRRSHPGRTAWKHRGHRRSGTVAGSRTSSTRCAGCWANRPRATCVGRPCRTSSSTAAGERANPPGAPASSCTSTTTSARRAAPGPSMRRSPIKRVLQRDGDSSYHVNNLHVRRRDVADIFLGTGLGGARTRSSSRAPSPASSRPSRRDPGVSRRSCRRFEVPGAAAGDRASARRHPREPDPGRRHPERARKPARAPCAPRPGSGSASCDLQADLAGTHQLLWYVKKQEIASQRGRLQRELDRVLIELEGDTARLREIERRLSSCARITTRRAMRCTSFRVSFTKRARRGC